MAGSRSVAPRDGNGIPRIINSEAGFAGIKWDKWDSARQHPIRETPKRPPDVSASRAPARVDLPTSWPDLPGLVPGVRASMRPSVSPARPLPRHARTRSGHLLPPDPPEWAITWMAETSPAMTRWGRGRGEERLQPQINCEAGFAGIKWDKWDFHETADPRSPLPWPHDSPFRTSWRDLRPSAAPRAPHLGPGKSRVPARSRARYKNRERPQVVRGGEEVCNRKHR